MSLLGRIFQQAAVTFSAANHSDLQRNLGVLKSLVDKVRFGDLNLSPEIITKQHFNQPDKAPCTYVGIYEDPTFTISLFVMAENYVMPLHDHPAMNGVLKCISGRLGIQSYTLHEQCPLDALERLYAVSPERPLVKKYVHCRREPEIEVDADSPASLLFPEARNLHQITAIGGPVAFFDILSPPYDSPIESRPHLRRKCTFFRLREALDNDLVIMEKIPQPLTYYCDSVEYTSGQ